MEKPGNLVEKFVTSADGTKVFAGALGNPDKPSLIFVHGWTLNSSIFNELFTKLELSKEFYLVRYDLRGHGRTGKPDAPEGYSSQKHAEDFAAVVREFSAKRPIFVGWSWGGNVAGDIISHLPSGSIHGAVYISSHPTFRNVVSLVISPANAAINGALSDNAVQASDFPVTFNRLCFARVPNAPPNFYEETIRFNAAGESFVSDNPAATYEIRLMTMGMMATMQPIHRMLAIGHTNDDKILEALADGFPMLEVIGTHDSFMKADVTVDSLKSIAKNLDVHLVEGASHTPFVDAPDEVMGAILKFAKKVNAQA